MTYHGAVMPYLKRPLQLADLLIGQKPQAATAEDANLQLKMFYLANGGSLAEWEAAEARAALAAH